MAHQEFGTTQIVPGGCGGIGGMLATWVGHQG